MATDTLIDAVSRLSSRQKAYLSRVVDAIQAPIDVYANRHSDIAVYDFVTNMADTLRIHHVNSSKSLGKEFFEHALVNVLSDMGRDAQLSPMGFPGADLIVDGSPWSLKTQADQSIKPHEIHISKFMELGKGRWETEEDLEALRDRMITHMEGYERILSMRYLSGARSQRGKGVHEYELIEISKAVLAESLSFRCEMKMESAQSPKPGLCRVTDESGVRFELYFDGGTERKLQVRKLRINLCTVHARWKFREPAVRSDPAGI